MSAIRVLRLLEYTYPDVESMQVDQMHWQVQTIYRPRRGYMIRSTTLPLEVLDFPEPEPPELVEP